MLHKQKCVVSTICIPELQTIFTLLSSLYCTTLRVIQVNVRKCLCWTSDVTGCVFYFLKTISWKIAGTFQNSYNEPSSTITQLQSLESMAGLVFCILPPLSNPRELRNIWNISCCWQRCWMVIFRSYGVF